VYTLSDADRLYLAGLGVDADALLAQVNAMTAFTSDRNERNHAAHYVTPSGAIDRPVLTVHTTGDAVAIPTNASGTPNASVGRSDALGGRLFRSESIRTARWPRAPILRLIR
jgi:hypothetical protein